jgi:chemotaxis protein methyltransferase CheR
LIKWKNHQTENVEVNLLLSALKERYGYDFTGYARTSLKRRLLALISYFDVEHLTDLISVVLYDEAVARVVINKITVPTSEFFRDAQVWQTVRETVLPQLDSFPRINIWQAGCGRGEETYTLAILLHEAGLLKKTRIYATDINPDFLEEARQGRWPIRHLVEWRENYLKAGGCADFDQYFVQQETEVAIRDEWKQSIQFMQHNLVADDVFKEVQWVVCRNVLIYFSEPLQDRVLQLLSNSLERGGFLLQGRSESILDLPLKFPELKLLAGEGHLYRKAIRATDHA